MKKKILLLTIFFIFVVSLITLILIYKYLDPYRNIFVSVFSAWTSFVLALTSFLTIFLYIIKKAYYRGEVFIIHIFSSLRQWIIFSIFLLVSVVFFKFWVFSFVTIFLLFLICCFFEMLFQNME